VGFRALCRGYALGEETEWCSRESSLVVWGVQDKSTSAIEKVASADGQSGRKATLTMDEEEGIDQVIMYRLKPGVCMTHGELSILARQREREREREREAGKARPKFFPSSRCPTRFVDRHRDRLTRIKTQILEVKRFKVSTKEIIHSYHIILQEAMEGLSVTKRGFAYKAALPLVICSKGMRANVVRSNDRENMSAMACVFDKGMTKKNVQRPVLLILIGHFSHISGVELNYAKAQNIKRFVLPSHTKRQERHLNRQSISPESLDAAFLGFQQLLELIPRGALMTRNVILISVFKAEEDRREKSAEKVKKAKERDSKELREKTQAAQEEAAAKKRVSRGKAATKK
ncbi:hypothetical protein GN958_ATG16945, partial [Phytophthora infestans]